MRRSDSFLAGLALASLVYAAPTDAWADASTQVGNATVTVGVGTAILTLPDVPSLMLRGVNGGVPLLQTFKISDDFDEEYGWNINGAIAVPLTGVNGRPKWLTLSGFWANIEDENSSICIAGAANRCGVAGLVDDPAADEINAFGNNQTLSRSEREVDHWGVSLESKWLISGGGDTYKGAPATLPRYFAIGADVRGIDQDIREDITNIGAGVFTAAYREDLDTTYYGAYAAWGGDVRPLLFKGFWARHGLQSSFMLRGGVYYADTDYDGQLSTVGGGGPGAPGTSALSLSSDDAAFIGGIVLETRKKIGTRTTLSLRSEYEYYSWVPEMAYNQADRNGASIAHANGQIGTVIGDDDAFSAKTMLRLTVALGGHDAPVK